MRTALVTGGAGYIGSHTCKALAAAGWNVIAFDDLSRGWSSAVRFGPLVEGSILDTNTLIAGIEAHRPDVVIHFAALAYVGESVEHPDRYYETNCVGTLSVLRAMQATGVRKLIFSSSCATYGKPVQPLIAEDHPQEPINPYGRSKLFCEHIIRDHCAAFGMAAVLLRYFNAAGCDPDGELGEDHDPETHAVPLAIRAALSEQDTFNVLGTDFDTPDGTAIRDYVHVSDLAEAHRLAAEHILTRDGCHAINLGTGVGTSVMALLEGVQRVLGTMPKFERRGRRQGDPAKLVALYTLAEQQLGWRPVHSSIDKIIQTAAAWQRKKRD
jgi:UDP-arabinose 4-epimerase